MKCHTLILFRLQGNIKKCLRPKSCTLQSYALYCVSAIRLAQNKWTLPKSCLTNYRCVRMCVRGRDVGEGSVWMSKYSFQRTRNECYFEGSRL